LTPAAGIEIRGVTKIFGGGTDMVRALDDVSLSIRENEFFTLLGPSGCGKTTLLRLIAGFEQPTKGHILLGGRNIDQLPPFRRPVNTVFQSYALFPHLTVGQNIGFGLEMLGKPNSEVAETVDRMLKLVRMEELKNRRTSQISGGQQQRVALARALAPHPKVLLLDEPLSALDFKLRKDMRLELKRLQNETGITFIFVTHDQEEALTMSDRLAVMRDGKVLQVDAPGEIYNHPADRFVADFIGDTNFLNADIISHEGGRAHLKLAAGAEVTAALPDGAARSGTVTLVVRPERARFVDSAVPAGESVLDGKVETVVYFGTDTHYHLALGSGEIFIARIQNDERGAIAPAPGDAVRVAFPQRSVQVLQD
jgi:spermidine/putrescine transport system ATP-binding protein